MHKHSRKVLIRENGEDIIKYWCFKHKKWCTFDDESLNEK
ncbi:hypothetical protein MBCUR_01200 [Methanobrevibacter curvatus]|uniref:Uncharacterized protein n=1 Tax=Methanobrevibacter curvatus TaxID=49547 RepID=A0A166DYG4_9EURY|nr:hypothetical protein MBCUR_01200 [Methanobrevibacter curvatus]